MFDTQVTSTLPWWYWALGIVGLTIITVVSRSFFLFSQREQKMPPWLARGLQYAPIAALGAVVAPEIFLQAGPQAWYWQDARIFAAAAGLACYYWRRDVLHVIIVGTVVFLPLHLYWA